MNKSVIPLMMAAAALSGEVGAFYPSQFNYCGGVDFKSVISARRKNRRGKAVKRYRKKK